MGLMPSDGTWMGQTQTASARSCLRQTRRKEEEALTGGPGASAGWREKGPMADLAGHEARPRREEAGCARKVSRTGPTRKERAQVGWREETGHGAGKQGHVGNSHTGREQATSEAGRLGRKQGKGK